MALLTLKENTLLPMITLFDGRELAKGDKAAVDTILGIRFLGDAHVDVKFTSKDKDALLNLTDDQLTFLKDGLNYDSNLDAKQVVAKLIIKKPKSTMKKVVDTVVGNE